jgi:hypothetical protein
MTKIEFITSASASGYCTKKQAEAYCKQNEKDIYIEDDFEEAWRFSQTYDYHNKGRHLGDGNYTSKHFYADGGEEGNR